MCLQLFLRFSLGAPDIYSLCQCVSYIMYNDTFNNNNNNDFISIELFHVKHAQLC